MEEGIRVRVWIGGGIILLMLHVALTLISPQFAYEYANIGKPIVWQVALMMAAGGIYLVLMLRCLNHPLSRWLVWWTLCVGLLMRGLFFFSTPMLEDDFYRYLWDGGVTASGINPYRYSPKQVQERNATPRLTQLGLESGNVIERVNHPSLRTVYPPVAQAAFALAHRVRPWSLGAWRGVVLLFDVATVILLMVLLRHCHLPSGWFAIYWWNPIVTTQLINVAHMDGLVLPFVVVSLLLAVRRRPIWACAMLGLAVGTKVWPMLLLPVILRPYLRQPSRLIPTLGIFGMLCLMMFLPVVVAGLGGESGFNAYSHHWEMNDALFMLILWGFQGLLKVVSLSWISAQSLTRCFIMLLLGCWVLWLNHRTPQHASDLLRRAMWTVALLFLLSPTQFPWYYTWVVPLLVMSPSRAMLLLTVLLPLYYLRFYLSARGHVDIFDYGIVWIEYVPVWVWALRTWY